jgi:hypothetical protein
MGTIATMTFEEYKDIEHSAPYVVHLEGKSGVGLLYYGSRHSCDPADPMFGDIQARFLALQPNVALVEGCRPDVPPPPTLPPDLDDVIRVSGEGGYVRFLANAHSVPVLGLDPPFDAEVGHLLTSFSKEQLFLFYCLEMIVQYRRMESRPSYEEYMGRFCEFMVRRLDLKASMAPLALLHTLHKRESGHELDWETFPDEMVCPLVWEGFTNEICRQSSYFRDSSQVAMLLEAVKGHYRAFAVVGASHVVMQERALREAFADVWGTSVSRAPTQPRRAGSG